MSAFDNLCFSKEDGLIHMVQRIAYLDCSSGVSGEMLLGALLDSGLALDRVREALTALPIQGYQLQLFPFSTSGMRGSRFALVLEQRCQELPSWNAVESLLRPQASALAPPVRERVRAIFRRLAQAEAVIQAVDLEKVSFDSINGTAALLVITAVVCALEWLEIGQIYTSPLPLTHGYRQIDRGWLPLPAPATLEILCRTAIAWKPCPLEEELVTPVGAALLAELAQSAAPPFSIERIGYGAGSSELLRAQCLRVMIAQPQESDSGAGDAETDRVAVLEANIDNMSGELLGGLMERLFVLGALDVSYTPLQMKKNRPATQLTVICAPEEGERLALVLLRETSTLGVRIQSIRRLKAQRSQQVLETPLGTLLVKVKRLGTSVISAAPEYEECRRVANERQIPLMQVYAVAQQAIQSAIIDTEMSTEKE